MIKKILIICLFFSTYIVAKDKKKEITIEVPNNVESIHFIRSDNSNNVEPSELRKKIKSKKEIKNKESKKSISLIKRKLRYYIGVSQQKTDSGKLEILGESTKIPLDEKEDAIRLGAEFITIKDNLFRSVSLDIDLDRFDKNERFFPLALIGNIGVVRKSLNTYMGLGAGFDFAKLVESDIALRASKLNYSYQVGLSYDYISDGFIDLKIRKTKSQSKGHLDISGNRYGIAFDYEYTTLTLSFGYYF